MKYIKKYENIYDVKSKSKDDWKVGDIIVATRHIVRPKSRWIIEGHKYKIKEIEKNNPPLKDRMILVDMDDKEFHSGRSPFKPHYYSKDDFVDLEQWEILNNINKYNL